MAPHPFLTVLRHPPSRRLWLGLSGSAVGDEVQRMALIWLAIGLVGADAAYLPAAQHGAVLVMGLLGGAFAGAWPPGRVMIAADLARAAIALVPVATALTCGLSLPLLVAVAVALAAWRGLFDPALQTVIPLLAPEPVAMRGLNGLIDATTRTARLGGPFLAGLLVAVMPPVHLLSLNALAYLGSAVAVRSLGDSVNRPDLGAPGGAWTRALQGWRALHRDRLVRMLVVSNVVMLAPWSLALSVGVPLLMVERELGFAGVAVVLGCYGVGDVLGNVLAAAVTARQPYRAMFLGYVVLGTGFVLLPLMPGLATMAVVALLAGLGGPFFFLQFLATVQTRFSGATLTAVMRLRMSLVAAALMLGALAGPLPLHALGAAVTVAGCGAVIALIGMWGVLRAERFARAAGE